MEIQQNKCLANNYRGIALQQTSFKCLTKILNERIINNILDKLPQEQYGFMQGKSTTDAIKVLINNISTSIKKPKGKMFACFVDFAKAFDSVERNILIRKLEDNFNIGGKTLSILKDILKVNFIYISDGIRMSKIITLVRGLLQGDSLSPTLFIMFIADLPNFLKKDIKKLIILLYADYLVFFSDNRSDIQTALKNLEQYILDNKLAVNIVKTKIMKFRKGGYLSRDDKFFPLK